MLRRVHLLASGITLFALFSLSSPFGWAQSESRQPRATTTSGAPAPSTGAPEQTAPARATPPDTDQSYRIGPSDIVDIRVFNHPELSKEARVSERGLIRLPLLGDIPAACQTEAQLVQVIAEKYKKYLRDPQVDVFIKDYRSQPVAVIGAVMQPSRFQLQRRVKLLELLTYAGGPNTQAGGTIHVIHNNEHDFCSTQEGKAAASDDLGMPLLLSIKLKDLLAGDHKANIYVEPGDVISLPIADQVFVTGSVVRPGPVPIVGRLTLTQAIYMSSGFIPDAAKKRVRVIRQVPGTDTYEEKTYNIEEIEKKRAEDIVLQTNDIVDVPNSAGKSIGRSMLGLVAPTAATLPLRVIRGY